MISTGLILGVAIGFVTGIMTGISCLYVYITEKVNSEEGTCKKCPRWWE